MYLFFTTGVICDTIVAAGSHEAGEILERRTERGTCDGEEAAGTPDRQTDRQTDRHAPGKDVLKRKPALT